MQSQAYGWPVAPALGVGHVVSGTDPTDQPLTSSVTALGGTKKRQKKERQYTFGTTMCNIVLSPSSHPG